mgnify:FL=1
MTTIIPKFFEQITFTEKMFQSLNVFKVLYVISLCLSKIKTIY